jgi:hypothetical protein
VRGADGCRIGKKWMGHDYNLMNACIWVVVGTKQSTAKQQGGLQIDQSILQLEVIIFYITIYLLKWL